MCKPIPSKHGMRITMWRCFCFLFVFFLNFCLVETDSYSVAQVGLEPRLARSLMSFSCLSIPSARTTDLSRHTWLNPVYYKSTAFSQNLRELSWSRFLLLFFSFTYRDKVPCSPGWPQTSAEDDLNTCFSCLWSQGPALQMCTDTFGFILRKACVSGEDFATVVN